MTPRSHNRLTAWLGLIAMWLVVFAPVVSQMLVSNRAQEPIAALCSALRTVQPGLMDQENQVAQANQVDHAGHAGATAVHLSHEDAFGACGYCHLLQHHVAMPTVAATEPPVVAVMTGTAPPTLSTRFTPLGAFPSGRPRAPPVVS
ncbi:DUF2946 domain-containing protein [Burkholderia sp. WSM2230]|uniref:DUF2946 domain-containing protein n=1 Tax=Burkholderia sp. WSM2230 TaxID=944435 RepID=UPI0004722C56|nr:DUF2946 domain-containing protein [Burkholderia sp. WSM2230]